MGAGIPDLSGIGDIADYMSQAGDAADVASSALPFPNPLMIWDVLSMIPGLGIPSPMDLIMGEFSGVPKGAKTAAAASDLSKEGGTAADLGSFINSIGGGKGSNVLSNPQFAGETNRMADALTWLSGSPLPGWKPMGSTGEIAGMPSGYDKPVNIMGVASPQQLAAILGKSPNLSPQQIAQIMPQLEALIKGQPSIAAIKDKIGPLITSAQQTNPTGGPLTNPLTYPLGEEGGGQTTNPLLAAGGLLSSLVGQGSQQNDVSQLLGLGSPMGFDVHVNPGAFANKPQEIQF